MTFCAKLCLWSNIYDRIRYLTGLKKDVAYAFSHNYVKSKIDSDDGLLLEETLTLHVVIFFVFFNI